MRVTKQERVEIFALKMKAIAKMDDTEYDPEADHRKADRLMADELTKLGYKKGVDIYHRMHKWYA